jgi:toxin ParE1/3/4
MRVRWTEGAKGHLRRILERVQRDDPSAARKLRTRLKHSVGELGDYPHIGRLVPEFPDEAIRERIVAPYRVFYLVQQETVVVLAIHHGRRDLSEEEDGPDDS